MSSTERLLRPALTILVGLSLGVASASTASARSGGGRGSSDGESLERQQQYNPIFIQPYGYADPARYRLGHPIEGYYARQAIEDEENGYRGNVRVRPYYRR